METATETSLILERSMEMWEKYSGRLIVRMHRFHHRSH